MAVLKYKNAQGEYVALVNYSVSPLTPVPTTGTSTTDVMSQNAVTTELNKKANSADVYSKTDANSTFLTEKQVNNIVYGSETKPTGNVEVVTTNNLTTTLATYSTTTEMNSAIDTKIAALVDGAPETLNTLNELAEALKTEQDAVDAIEAGIANKADKATTIAGYGITDAKIANGVITLGANTITPLTQHQDISGKLNVSTYNTDKATFATKSEISDMETKTNAAATYQPKGNYITSIPAEYVTDTELTAKSYTTLAAVKADSDINATISEKDWNTGHTSTTNATIPVTKRLCIATWTSSYTLSVGTIADGRELHIIGKNNGSSDITITFPSSGIVKMSGDSITIAAGAYADINIISDGTNKYLRAL